MSSHPNILLIVIEAEFNYRYEEITQKPSAFVIFVFLLMRMSNIFEISPQSLKKIKIHIVEGLIAH